MSVTNSSPVSENLRSDVRLLSTLLGEILQESGSPQLLEDVEALRQATITAYRDR